MTIAILILILFAISDEMLIGFVFTIFGLILIVMFGTYSLGQAYDLEMDKNANTRKSSLLLSILCAIQLSVFLLIYLR